MKPNDDVKQKKQIMKKLILILLTAVAFSCGDGSRSSKKEDNDMNDNTEVVKPDTVVSGDMESDTTSIDQQRNDSIQ